MKIKYSEEVMKAKKNNLPIVALESTIITHGMPYPENLKTALAVENIIRDQKSVPATIGVLDGNIQIGHRFTQLETLAQERNVRKLSRADLPFCISNGSTGSTTVAATMICASMAEIKIFATGGIGGVHLDAKDTFDISADLNELSKTNLIKEINYTNDCVTIPGFGSFIANKFPAIYIKEESKFYPPSRRITFNSKIKNNDGLLANFISTKSKISYDEALKKIHTEVIKWNRIIRKEPLVIKDLGELIFSKDENLVFKPDLDSNHYLESFGLSPIYVNKIESKINTYNNSSLLKYNELSKSN